MTDINDTTSDPTITSDSSDQITTDIDTTVPAAASTPTSTSPDTSPSDAATVPSTPETSDTGFDIQAFEATRAIVTRQAERLEELKRETKLIGEQLQSLMEGDAKLSEEEQQAKEYTQSVKQRKTEIMETQQARQLKAKLGDLKEERTDLEDSLSNHLFDLYQTTGVMEFEDITGNVWEYKIKARLGSKKKV